MVKLFSVPVAIVKPGMKIAETVYNDERIKLLNRGMVLDSHLIERLRNAGVETVWISDGDESLSEASENYHVSEEAQATKEAQRLYDKTTKYLQEIRNNILTVGTLDMYYVNKFVEKIVEPVLSNYRPFTEMVRLRKTAPTVTEHMADVCVLAIATGKITGMSQYDIRVLAAGALLHDIGKFFIPDSILNNTGRLSEEDQFLVMKHVTLGHDLLSGIKNVSKHILAIVNQHHEKLDGSGYPYGLSGEYVDKFARIVAVADTYSEAAGIQKNGAKYASYEVAELIGAQAGIKLDREICHQFLNSIIAYPLQSIVRLNTGEVAKVVYQNRAFPTRPVVKVGLVQIDLSKAMTVFIEEFIQLEGDKF